MVVKNEHVSALLTLERGEVLGLCPVGSQVLHLYDRGIVGLVLRHLGNEELEVAWSAVPLKRDRDRNHQGTLVIEEINAGDCIWPEDD